jgi:succinyl-diaminopimelate desuccinylase
MNVVTSFDLGAGAGSGHARVLEFNGGERANIVAGGAHALLQVPAGQEGWIVAEMEDLVEDARFAAGGPGPLEFAFEQGTGTVKVTVKGKGAHASTPDEGTNAITGLAFVLGSLGDSLEKSKSIAFIAEGAEIYGKGLNIESCDDVSGRLSCNLGLARVEEKDGKRLLRCTYNIRYPVKADGEELKSRALSCRRPDGVNVEVPNVGKTHYTDPESDVVKKLLKVYREETGDNSPPMAIGGGTYAKVIHNGVAFGPGLPGAPELAHQADERISLDDLWFMVRIYARALFALAV